MNRRKLTAEEMAAKVAKMKATKAAKKAAALKEVGYTQVPKKIRRKRILTEEQKQAARERLEKARAARKKTGSTPYGVHPSVMDIPEDDAFSYKKVKEWIAHNKDLASEERQSVRSDIKGARSRLGMIEGYLRDMQHYLKTGDWISNFYGKEQGMKVKWRVLAMAYHHEGPFKGMVKRDVGYIYPDVGEWTQEMHDDYYGVQQITPKSKYKRKK